MTSILRWLDGRTKLMVILLLFWALFWGLNGGDKFFANGSNSPNTDGWARNAVVLDNDGEIVGNVYPTEPRGWYGVNNREDKTINYFDRLGLSSGLAKASLYGIAVFELVLGAMFLMLFLYEVARKQPTKGVFGVFDDRTLHRLAFKGSAVVFLLFSSADILFGDRTELWEHGTFFVMALVSYNTWYRTDEWTRAQEAEGNQALATS